MKRVKLLRTEDNGGQDHFATILFDGKLVTYDGLSPNYIRDFEKYGIYVGNKTFYPKDGLTFLENLKYAYSGSVIRATDMEEID